MDLSFELIILLNLTKGIYTQEKIYKIEKLTPTVWLALLKKQI